MNCGALVVESGESVVGTPGDDWADACVLAFDVSEWVAVSVDEVGLGVGASAVGLATVVGEVWVSSA